MISMTDLVTIGVDLPTIDSGCYSEIAFIELIRMNLLMVLYLIFNQVDSCYDSVYDPLT